MSPCPNISIIASVGDTPEKRSFGLFLYVFGQIFITLCLMIFFWGKYHAGFERLKARHTVLVLAVYAGAIIHHQGDPLELMIGPANYYCVVKLLMSVLVIPFAGAGIVGKLVSFFFRSRFEQQAIVTRNNQTPSQDDENNRSEYENRPTKLMGTVKEGAKVLFLFKGGTGLNLGSLRFLQSGVASGVVTMIMFLIPSGIVVIVVAGADPVMASGCTACLSSFTVASFLVCQASISSILTFIALWRVRQLPDNWGIIGETLLCLVFAGVSVIGYALSFFIPVAYQVWSFTFFLSFGLWGVVASQTILQVGIAISKEGRRFKRMSRRVANATEETPRSASKANEKLKLPQILADSDMAKRFEEHLGREFGVESLFFYRDAQRWTKEYNDVSTSTRKTRAKHIVNVYIRSNGVFAVNVPSAVTKPLITGIEQQIDPPLDFFNEAIYEIQDLLERGALARFITREKITADKLIMSTRLTVHG